ncbi:MAG: choice-of-anchor I family protein [Thermoleophilia bacterium]|nr:choice-of-anchor I family protein [Thermoleophilia bacterium]
MTAAAAAASLAGAAALATPARPGGPSFALLGSYATGLGGESSGETAALQDGRMYVTSAEANVLDIVDVSDPAAPVRTGRVDLAPYGSGVQSVDATHGLVAVAVKAAVKTDPGRVVFLRPDGTFVTAVTVGALPDMLAFSPDGKRLAVANEGEPNGYGRADSVDPEGSVSIIDIRPARGRRPASVGDVRTATFTAFNEGGDRHGELPAGVRLNGPGASVAQDLEPEYVSWDDRGRTAYVTLQENNAVARVDARTGRVKDIAALGTIDRAAPGFGMDASDKDGGVNIANWPVRALPMPDGIATFEYRGRTFYVTANEGDARDYDGFSDETRVKSLTLDPAAFPAAAMLQKDANLGRLNVSATDGRGPNGYVALYAFGARSASIRTADGTLVWDSGDAFERTVAAENPAAFNVDNTDNGVDGRSDNKGPEPEGVAVGRVGRGTYAFVGLERTGGFMVIDVTNPYAARVVNWVNNRDYAAEPAGPDSGPEIIRFIPGRGHRGGTVMVSNEITGTVSLYAAARVVR